MLIFLRRVVRTCVSGRAWQRLKSLLRPQRGVAYRLPRRAITALNAEATQLVELPAGDPAVNPPQGRLYQAWRHIPGAHKWHHYFETYEEILQSFAGRPIRMLEIGVYKGASVQMWRQTLPVGSTVVGIDIDPACRQFDNPAHRLHIRIGDQSDPEFLAKTAAEFGPFDFILDDGSHQCSHMIVGFRELFTTALVDGGTYLVEDTHTNFWPAYRDQAYSLIDFAKELVDLMHAHFVEHTSESHFRIGLPERSPRIAVPRITSQIREIVFRDSLVIIRKRQRTQLPISEHL